MDTMINFIANWWYPILLILIVVILIVIFIAITYNKRKAKGPAIMEAQESEYASFDRRFGAYLMDYIVLIGLPIQIGSALISLPGFISISAEASMTAHKSHIYFAIGLFLILCGPAFFILNVFLLGKNGQSIGKKISKIRCVGLENRPLGFGKALLREVFKVVSYFPFCLGFLWMLFNKKRQTWHDMVVNSYVYRIH